MKCSPFHVTAISEPSFNGHRITRLLLEYESAIDPSSLNIGTYTVETALRERMKDAAPNGHLAGWYLTYRIPAILEWLIQQ